ncbi:MAG: DUF1449 family protein [Leptolyngbyaceae cyanobacterium MO_188.B28]|nr:DUF1449 family protein [Leptolyngbyaceae cyanobacterium MO_188.B28]
MLFNTAHVHWWIGLAIGAIVTLLPLLIDLSDFELEFDLDLDSGFLTPMASVLSFLGFGQVPLLLSLGSFIMWFSLFGWMFHTFVGGGIGSLATGLLANGVTLAAFIVAFIPSGWLSRVIGRLVKTNTANVNSARHCYGLGAVKSTTVPRLSTGKLGRVKMDVSGDFINVVLPDDAGSTLKENDPVRVLELASETPLVYFAVLKDSDDELARYS